MKIINGDKIVAKTHAEFLNKILDKDYKAWMRCLYRITDEMDIYFIKLDGNQSKQGWTSTLVNDNCFIEEYTGTSFDRLESHRYTDFPKKRATFDIQESNGARKYIFRGIFEYSKESTNNRRIWNKVAGELRCQ